MAYNKDKVKNSGTTAGAKYTSTTSLNVRTVPDPCDKSNILGAMVKSKSNGTTTGKTYLQTDNATWYELKDIDLGNGKKVGTGWVNTFYVEQTEAPKEEKKQEAVKKAETSAAAGVAPALITQEKYEEPAFSNTSTTSGKYKGYVTTDNTYDKISADGLFEHLIRCRNAFGSPALFLDSTDIIYDVPNMTDAKHNQEKTVRIGRVMMETIYSNPRIFSICPGKVNYLPDASKQGRERSLLTLGQALTSTFNDEYNKSESDIKGQLYNFKSTYTDYMNRFNLLARVSAIMLGLGETCMPGTTIKLAEYDYAYYTSNNRKKQSQQQGYNGTKPTNILDKVWNSFTGTASSTFDEIETYVHYFLMNEGTSKQESISVQKGETPISSVTNQLNEKVKMLRFFFDLTENDLTDTVQSDLDSLVTRTRDNSHSTILSTFAGLAKGYLAGGTLVLPEMVDSVNYSDAVSVRMKFVAPYGDKLTVFLSTIIPTLSLFNFVVPKQVSGNMYTYPYILKVYQQGWYTNDLCIMENLNIERGGPDNTSWTIDGLSTEIDVSFDIVPLVSQMMSPSSTDPLLFLSNAPLVQYLGNLCGLDLKTNQLKIKADILTKLIVSGVKDYPTQVGRSHGEKFANKFSRLFGWK